MRIMWTPQAAQDRADIWDYLHAFNPRAAIDIDARISGSVSRLIQHPRGAPLGLIKGTRELSPHPNYRIVYEIDQKIVWVLAIIHTARQWPPSAR